MGFSLDVSVPVMTVFFQGLLSFFSPCVLPLLPLYIGYLSGGTAKRGEDGVVRYNRKKVFFHTLFFVLGVSFAFFALGLGVSALGRFFKENQLLFARIGGGIVILFGVYELGIFGKAAVFERERRLPFRLNMLVMSPVSAFLLGFTFSFAWTPCVGPALASVLLMAASSGTRTAGFLLIGVYTLGFVLPFLAVGAFTTTLLGLFKKHGNVVQYTVKAGAVLMIFMGIFMFTGQINSMTGYLGTVTEKNEGRKDASKAGSESVNVRETDMAKTEEAAAVYENNKTEAAQTEESRTETEAPKIPAIDFTLKDQYGNQHTFSDYKGKTVFLNFWATWCPPCRAEMPEIQRLYEEYQEAGDDSLVILGIAAPGYGREGTEEEICQFLEENGYTYPVVLDTEASVFTAYGVYSYPTTFMIDTDGNVFGYITGQLSREIMQSIIEQTVTGIRE